jgi:glycosyltransferase involved in cell wall biosynthesis
MHILVGHNFYQQPGGEDTVFATETSMLEDSGHSVVRYSQHNDAIRAMSPFATGFKTVWNSAARKEIARLLEHEQPAVCHFHNTFPLISPSAFYAASSAKIPVVLTLHNYRLLCPAGVLLRQGTVCEECVGRPLAYPGIAHACYRNSTVQTAGVAAMTCLHRLLNTWRERVDLYIALTEFARRKFIEGGLPAEKIVVKPNFVYPDPGFNAGRERFALFVGRLSPEKGIATLLDAWSSIGGDLPLRIAGEGPMENEVRQACQTNPAISWLGRLTRPAVIEQMKRAWVLVFPSIWYESLPLTVIEAFATGLPVIAGNLGSMAELVEDGRTGLLFEPGSAGALATAVRRLLVNDGLAAGMRWSARQEFETRYTRSRNCEVLLRCYGLVTGRQPQTECVVAAR